MQQQPMIKRLTGLIVLLLALVACTEQAPLTEPQAQPLLAASTWRFIERISFGFEQFHPCTGETVDMEFFLQGNYHFVTNDRFTFLTAATYYAHFTGIGQETGIRYIGHDTGKGNERFPVAGEHFLTYTQNTLIVAQGDAPNYTVKILWRSIVNANGEVTSEILSIEEECRG